jgi:hypothetical protein
LASHIITTDRWAHEKKKKYIYIFHIIMNDF